MAAVDARSLSRRARQFFQAIVPVGHDAAHVGGGAMRILTRAWHPIALAESKNRPDGHGDRSSLCQNGNADGTKGSGEKQRVFVTRGHGAASACRERWSRKC